MGIQWGSLFLHRLNNHINWNSIPVMLTPIHLSLLKNRINSGQFPKTHPHFAGANLIITDNSIRKSEEGDLVIITQFAGAVSWLIDELKRIFVDELNYKNKHQFYGEIGIILESALHDDNVDIFAVFNHILSQVETNWKPLWFLISQPKPCLVPMGKSWKNYFVQKT